MASCKNNKQKWGGKKNKQRKTRKIRGGECGCQKKLFTGGNKLLELNPATYPPLNNEVNNPNTPAFVTDTRMQGVPVVKGGKKKTNKRRGGKKCNGGKKKSSKKIQKGGTPYSYTPGDTTLAYTFGNSSGGITNFSNTLVGATVVNPSVDSQPISNKWGAHNPFLV